MKHWLSALLFLFGISTVFPDESHSAARQQTQAKAKKGKRIHVRPDTTHERARRIQFTRIQTEIDAAHQECMRSREPQETALRGLAKFKLAGTLSTPERMGFELCLSDALGLEKIEHKGRASALVASGALVPLAGAPGVDVSYVSDPDRQVALPHVRDYVLEFVEYLKDGKGTLDEQFRVTSLLRYVSLVRELGGTPVSCNTPHGSRRLCSTHTTGATIDIGNHPDPSVVSPERKERILKKLLCDRAEGRIIFIEERWAPHFHVFILPPHVRVPDPVGAEPQGGGREVECPK